MDQTTRELVGLADALAGAWERAEAVEAPSRVRPATDLAEAYRIQEMVVERRMAAGRQRVGWKLGLTSSPAAVPIVGTLLDDMVVGSGARLSPAQMVAPLIEAELAFVVGEPIGPETEADEIAAGPHQVAPALEVIDYRTKDSSGSVDWVADNATVAYAVVGERIRLAEAGPLGSVSVELSRDGGVVASGRGSLVMGDPLRAIQWLAEHLFARDRALEPGQVILTGSLTGHHAVERGAAYVAAFGRIGEVSVSFGNG